MDRQPIGKFNNAKWELKKGDVFSMASVNLINPPKALMNTLTISRTQAKALGLKRGEVVWLKVVHSR